MGPCSYVFLLAENVLTGVAGTLRNAAGVGMAAFETGLPWSNEWQDDYNQFSEHDNHFYLCTGACALTSDFPLSSFLLRTDLPILLPETTPLRR